MRHRRSTAALIIALAAVLAATATPSAQARTADSWRLAAQAEPNQVQNLTVRQSDGYATLAWTPVDGATDYQIERTPVDADGNPTAGRNLVGVWRPNRQINHKSPPSPTPIRPGHRFRGGYAPASAPPSSRTPSRSRHHPGALGRPGRAGENLRTQWETTRRRSTRATSTSTPTPRRSTRLSDRVRVVEIGRTVLGRPINMFVLGYPHPGGHAGGRRRDLARC